MRNYLKKTSTVAAALSLLGAMASLPAIADDVTPATPAPGTSPATSPANPATPPTPETAAAAAATPAPNYGIQYNGLLDGYYQLSLVFPKGSAPLAGDRAYDVRHNTPTLALAEINVFQTAKPGGLGFKSTLITGDVADINHGGLGISGDTEPRFKNVQQLYATYAFPGAGGGVDFGKFYTPFGYEVTEANANYNYSRSLPYFLLPVYHAGLRVYTPSMNGFVATGYVVNSVFNTPTSGIHNDSGNAAFVGQLSYTDPAGKYTFITNLGLSKDKIGGVKTKVTLSDNDFTYNLSPSQLIGLNYVYGKLKQDVSEGTDITENGYAVYYKQTLTPKTGIAFRVSGYNQKITGAKDSKPIEETATYEIRPAANFTTRFEVRHDSVNSGNGAGIGFAGSDGKVTKNDQTTVTVAGLFTF